MTAIHSQLDDSQRKAAGEALQGSLVDLLDLSLQGKQAHWTIVGKDFRPLHLQLDEIVTLARNSADDVAERAVAIGVHPDGRAGTIAAQGESQQPEVRYLADTEVVTHMVSVLEGIVRRFRERIASTEEELVSQDLLISITSQLDKQSWMLQAQQF